LKNNRIQKTVGEMNRLGSCAMPYLFGFDFELENSFLIENPLQQNKVLFRTPDACNYTIPEMPRPDAYIRIENKGFISLRAYQKGFSKVLGSLQRGDTYLCNYTVKTRIASTVSLPDLFLATKSLFGLCYHNRFVSFSPERFVRIADGVIVSNPMKGTLDANMPDAAKKLTDDYKEDCEHNTIVDLIRNDIGKVATRVNVNRFKYLDTLTTDRGNLLQMSSEISGHLPPDYLSHLGDIVLSMLPAGSVSGAPKASTLKVIRESENRKRGYYTGVFGYFDGQSLDSAVLIRFIEKNGNKWHYRSGGGITINSICEREREEAAKKIYLPV